MLVSDVMARLHDERQASATFAELDTRAPRGLSAGDVAALSDGQWLRGDARLVISGPPGVGKTYLACAVARAADGAGRSALYCRASSLVGALEDARCCGRYGDLAEALRSVELLVVDEFGLGELGPREARDLVDVMSPRRATALVSHIVPDAWYDFIGEPALAAAFVDRMRAPAHELVLSGPSLRG